MAVAGSYLVDSDWVNAHLLDPSVRIVDCTVFTTPQPTGPSKVRSGYDKWLEGHIPGAAFLDMIVDLSAPREGMPYNLPDQQKIRSVLNSIGVSNQTTVVLYGGGYPSAVTRAWWVLRVSGVLDVRILDGGWPKWRYEQRPVSSEIPVFKAGNFTRDRDESMVCSTADVLGAMDAPGVCIVNALSPSQHLGEGSHFGRPGRIPGSVNIPAKQFIDPDSQIIIPKSEIEAACEKVISGQYEKIILYCGAGISATTVAFALAELGCQNVAVYDGSLLEWANKHELPMDVG